MLGVLDCSRGACHVGFKENQFKYWLLMKSKWKEGVVCFGFKFPGFFLCSVSQLLLTMCANHTGDVNKSNN